MPVTVNGATGAKARVSHVREIFENSDMNTALPCTFKCIFRGYRLCEVAYTNPPNPPFNILLFP